MRCGAPAMTGSTTPEWLVEDISGLITLPDVYSRISRPTTWRRCAISGSTACSAPRLPDTFFGRANISFRCDCLTTAGLAVVAEDVGDIELFQLTKKLLRGVILGVTRCLLGRDLVRANLRGI